MTSPLWRNWAGTQHARPVRTVRPRSVDELRTLLAQATADGLRAKAMGSGHSFTAVAATGGMMIHLDALDAAVRIDRVSGLATVEAGMRLHQLNRVLAAHGLAMANLGDIDRQTIAGAISTGTHGTGARFGGLATQVRALELALADGSAVRCSAEERPELFAAARVGLGALGVITRVTLQCVPAFTLHAAEGPMPLGDVLERLDALNAENDHFEFYWFPHTAIALTKRNNRVPDAAGAPAPGRLRTWLDEEFLSNTVFERVNRLGRAAPALAPGLNAVSARALSARQYTDVSEGPLGFRTASQRSYLRG